MNEGTEVVERLRQQGNETATEAAALIEWLLDERAVLLDGAEYVIRVDPEDGLGVTYFHPDMIGHVIAVRDTGRRADTRGAE